MFTALWHFSAAIRGYLRFFMPTNRAVDWLRSPSGLKWAFPVAFIATPAYLGLMALAIEFAARPGLGFLNVLVFLFFCYADIVVMPSLRWVAGVGRLGRHFLG
ncbi:MAG TPA: hypothetical protein VFO98_12255 [Marmoricola sp.]|nr:hypothetical protein [Marmoricola sp.]